MTIVPSIYHPFNNNLLVPDMHNTYLVPLWSLWSIRDNRYYADSYKNNSAMTMDIGAMKTESRVL